ncbi:DNA polymerase III subunit tau [bacterium HR34]|nr:DNA polymerase III subunit tau [bacterium HR34]
MVISIYTKYRPQKFSDLIGQEIVANTLRNTVKMGLVSHAYLFAGPRGSGKTSTARILAKAVNCENPKDGEPCNKCKFCEEIKSGKAIDIIEIDAASNRGIEEIRELKENARYAPSFLKYKVFIIDESHQLTKEAVNALLKIVEEPPSHVIFIFATTDPQKMIETIISRCQRFDFKKLSISDIVKKLEYILKNENIPYEKDALEYIAVFAQGAMRDAEVLLEQIIYSLHEGEKITKDLVLNILGGVDPLFIKELFRTIVNKKFPKAIEILNSLVTKGYSAEDIAKNLINFLRVGLMLKVDGSLSLEDIPISVTSDDIEFIKSEIKNVNLRYLYNVLDLFLEALPKIKYAPVQQLPLELAILSIFDKEGENSGKQ